MLKLFRNIIAYLLPLKKFQTAAAAITVLIVGLGLYSLYIAKATSYLSDAPETCVNCHIMTPQYRTWQRSSHHNVTNCNDCHVPHNNVVNKYFFKAKDGLRHSSMFALRMEPQVIVIHEAGANVVHKNCIRCHQDQILDAKSSAMIASLKQSRTATRCWKCHSETPHGKVNSLSSVPYGKLPEEISPVPKWIREKLDQEYLPTK